MGTFVGFSWKRLLQVSGGETAQMAGNERREAAGGGISEASVGSLGGLSAHDRNDSRVDAP